MSKAKLTFHSALWNHIGKILEYVLMYLTSILIARGLGVEDNGRFVGLFSLSQLLLVLSSLGLETSLNKFIPQLSHDHDNAKASYILKKSLILRVVAFTGVTMLFYLALIWLSLPFFSASQDVMIWVMAFTGIRSMTPLFAMVLTAQLRTSLTALINLGVRTIEIAAITVLTGFEFTVVNIFIVFLCTSAIHVAAYAMFSKLHLTTTSSPVDMKPVITFGSIYWLNTFVDFILGRQGDVLLLSNLLPDSTQAGLYDVAYSVSQLATMAFTLGLAGVTFATFARLAVTDQAAMDKFYSFSIRMISLVTIPLYAFFVLNAEAILTVLYSQQYIGAVILIQGILLFRTLSRLFGGSENGEYLLSQGRVAVLVALGVGAACVNTALNIILIPRLGAIGAVIASGSGNVLVNLLGAVAVFRVSSNRLQLFFWLKLTAASFLASFICSSIFAASGLISLIGAGALYMIILGVMLLLIKPLTKSDFVWLSAIDRTLAEVLRRFTRTELGTSL